MVAVDKIQLWGDAWLLDGDDVAIDPDCCCSPCCHCSVLEQIFNLGLLLKLRLSGPIGGECTMGPGLFGGDTTDLCSYWATLNVEPNCVYTGPCVSVYNMQVIYFFCPTSPLLSEYTLEAGLANLGCDFYDAPGDPTPRIGIHAKRPTTIFCDQSYDALVDTPTSTWPFYAKFTFPMEEQTSGGCACDATDQIFEISLA